MRIWYVSVPVGLLFGIITYFIADRMRKGNESPLLGGNKSWYNVTLTVEAKNIQAPYTIKDIIELYKQKLEKEQYDYSVKTIKDNIFQITVKNFDQPEELQNLIYYSGKLEILEVYRVPEVIAVFTELQNILDRRDSVKQLSEAPPVQEKDSMSQQVKDLLNEMGKNESKKSGETGLISYNPNLSTDPSFAGYVKAADTALIRIYLNEPSVLEKKPPDLRYIYGRTNDYGQSGSFKLYAVHQIQGNTRVIDNEDIRDARMEINENGRATVNFEFTDEGSRKWANITRKNVGNYLAIVVNGIVIMAPIVEAEITGGKALIDGNLTVTECSRIAAMMKSRPLPAEIQILQYQQTRKTDLKNSKNLLMSLLVTVLCILLTAFIFKSLTTNQKRI